MSEHETAAPADEQTATDIDPTPASGSATATDSAAASDSTPVTDTAADTGTENTGTENTGTENTGTEDPGAAADSADAQASASERREERLRRLEEEGDFAADYLEELMDIADLDGDIDIDVDGDRASVEIRGADELAALNEPKGELLDALQELTRLAVQARTGQRSRLMLDIGGFRASHKSELEELAEKAIEQAKGGTIPVPLRPMNPFERKVVHDVAKREGLRSESDGEGKTRHVVIYPHD